jgi:hypothetical protein
MGCHIIARHVIGCNLTPETRFKIAFDDAASTALFVS